MYWTILGGLCAWVVTVVGACLVLTALDILTEDGGDDDDA